MSRKQQTVIFLDIDGVLQHDAYRRYCLRRDWNYNWRVDPTCLLLLKEIQEQHPEVEVVISSSWRINKIKSEFEHLFRQSGYEIKIHDNWKTVNHTHPTYNDYYKYCKYTETFTDKLYRPKDGDNGFYLKEFEKLETDSKLHYRGWQILKWLVDQPDDIDTRFFILDDSNDMLMLEPELIHIKHGEVENGFTPTHQKKILDLLKDNFEEGMYRFVGSRYYFLKDRYLHPENY